MSIKQLISAAKAQKVAYYDSCDDTGEVIANLKLAYRHSEDSVMRLIKCIQTNNGWEIWDKPKDATKDMSILDIYSVDNLVWLVCENGICNDDDWVYVKDFDARNYIYFLWFTKARMIDIIVNAKTRDQEIANIVWTIKSYAEDCKLDAIVKQMPKQYREE
jgi:hypothetical protein